MAHMPSASHLPPFSFPARVAAEPSCYCYMPTLNSVPFVLRVIPSSRVMLNFVYLSFQPSGIFCEAVIERA